MSEERSTNSTTRARTAAAGTGVLVAAVVLVLIVYGGYGQHWRWIGVNGKTATLWDWLHLLLLPLAAVVLALWLRHRPQVSGAVATALTVVALVFVSVVLAGYLVPWGWTGFTGNTVWDWLNLAALPLAVALIPVLVELRADWGRRHAAVLAVVAAAFLGLVLAGYLAHWRWTGFTGNTVWDWLHLLLLPLLVPAVIVPVLRPALAERFRGEDADDR
ncbi:MAG: hypothetical protein ACRDPM_10135 [Solirubrobacteraceae bacterium]